MVNGDVGQGNDGDENVNDVHIAGVDGNVDVKKRKHPASAHLRPAAQRSHQLHWAGEYRSRSHGQDPDENDDQIHLFPKHTAVTVGNPRRGVERCQALIRSFHRGEFIGCSKVREKQIKRRNIFRQM